MNQLQMKTIALVENELVIRTALVAFVFPLTPTNDEIMEIKTICAEAVVNAIVHAYPQEKGNITVHITTDNRRVEIVIQDEGIGMSDIENKRASFVTTKSDQEHSGMGFTIMETFSDMMKVESTLNEGTTVTLVRYLHDIQ